MWGNPAKLSKEWVGSAQLGFGYFCDHRRS